MGKPTRPAHDDLKMPPASSVVWHHCPHVQCTYKGGEMEMPFEPPHGLQAQCRGRVALLYAVHVQGEAERQCDQAPGTLPRYRCRVASLYGGWVHVQGEAESPFDHAPGIGPRYRRQMV